MKTVVLIHVVLLVAIAMLFGYYSGDAEHIILRGVLWVVGWCVAAVLYLFIGATESWITELERDNLWYFEATGCKRPPKPGDAQ